MTFKEPSPETIRDVLVDRAEYIRILEAKVVEKESEILALRADNRRRYDILQTLGEEDLAECERLVLAAEAKLAEYANTLVEEANRHRDTKAEVARLRAARDEARATKDMHKERQEEAWAEVETLRAAFNRYSQHDHSCPCPNSPCDCGLVKIRAALSPEVK